MSQRPHAIVSGASSGIGAAIAQRLLRDGVHGPLQCELRDGHLHAPARKNFLRDPDRSERPRSENRHDVVLRRERILHRAHDQLPRRHDDRVQSDVECLLHRRSEQPVWLLHAKRVLHSERG